MHCQETKNRTNKLTNSFHLHRKNSALPWEAEALLWSLGFFRKDQAFFPQAAKMEKSSIEVIRGS